MRGETVTVIRRPAGYDPHGTPVEGPTLEFDVKRCALAPRTTAREGEVHDYDHDGLIVGARLFAPAGVDIRHTDEVRARGEVYQVEGDPGRWASPYSSRRPGQVVTLRRTEG